MEKLVIEGGQRLQGEVQIGGAKNAALPLLFASILSDQSCTFENIPNLVDIETTFKMLRHLGVLVQWDAANHRAHVQAKTCQVFEAPYDLVRTMRASVLVLGPLLSRFGQAKVSLPGGCSIGARPVNLHLMALEKMGAKIELDRGYIHARCQGLKGAVIRFPTISVGATENILMAAALAQGETIIENAALEPEIVDLAKLLKAMGVGIDGEGTSTIRIQGAQSLRPVQHYIVADRIEAGTYIAAVATAGGSIKMPGVNPSLLGAVIEKLREANVTIQSDAAGLQIHADPQQLVSVNVTTKEFPGFPTDMQAQVMAAMCVASGTSVFNEHIFENRFMHVPELQRLGADIAIEGHTAIVRGRGCGGLSGATVMATDLRASASLVLAGLAAKGTTTVRRIYHLDRGYEHMEQKLCALGAKIKREKES